MSKMLYARTRTSKVPIPAPINAIITASVTPGGNEGKAPLNGMYAVVDAIPISVVVEAPPVPPPVRFAPFGCPAQLGHITRITKRLTPMGLEPSVNEQVSDVQRHSPLIGSQKGVEHFVGT